MKKIILFNYVAINAVGLVGFHFVNFLLKKYKMVVIDN